MMALASHSFGQSIAKRWQSAGRLRDGKISLQDVKSLDFDFSQPGKFTIEQDGVIISSGTSVIAQDGKSILLKDGNKRQTLQITKLTTTELKMITKSFFSGSDTLVCYPSLSPSGRKAKQHIKDYLMLVQTWDVMISTNFSRAQTLLGAALLLKDKEKENEFLDMCIGYEKEIQQYSKTNIDIDEDMLNEYGLLQDQIQWGFTYVFHLLKEKYPNLKTSTFFKDEPTPYIDKLTKDFSRIDAAAEQAKIAFDEAYKKYQQSSH